MRAFQDLYEAHYADVFRFAFFLTGDRARAEDLTADTFVRAWVARDRINLTTVRAYLLTITKNLYRDECRRVRPTAEIEDTVRDPRPGPDIRVEHATELARVRVRLRDLAQGDREALVMFILRGMSHREIAEALGVTIGAVKSRIFRARATLSAAVPGVGDIS